MIDQIEKRAIYLFVHF